MKAVRRLMLHLGVVLPVLAFANGVVTPSYCSSGSSSTEIPELKTKCLRFSSEAAAAASPSSEWGAWFAGIKRMKLPNIVKTGDPVLHEPAREVDLSEMNSERVQKIIDDMIHVMRKGHGVGLAAPQIGIPLKIIVLEYRKERLSYHTMEEIKAQDRRPFDLLVILNPKMKKKSNRTALFFEGCLSVDGHHAAVERYLDVEVTGFDRYGEPMKINASGWQARILQHECDHLDGTMYVDKMVPRTFRTHKNVNQPLAHGCPELGPRD